MAAAALGVFTGLGGASHGPGEMLQGNIAPDGLVIRAWPSLTVLDGEPAFTVVPSYLFAGILTVIVGVGMAIWAWKFVQHRLGGPVLLLFAALLFIVGGGLIPPFFGFAAGALAFAAYYQSNRNGGVI